MLGRCVRFGANKHRHIKELKFFRSLLLFLASKTHCLWLILFLRFALLFVAWGILAVAMLRWCLGIRGLNWQLLSIRARN